MDFESISDEVKALVTIQRHIGIVQSLLGSLIDKLHTRLLNHDLSKFSKDEFAGFVEINQIARLYPYGSDEYKESIKNNKAVALHYSRNTHHPEYHPNGIDGMSLGDWLEMVVDWKAANITYGNTSIQDNLKIQRDRFGLEDKHMWLIELILEELA